METDRSNFCGCKGIRSCLKCEEAYGIPPKKFNLKANETSYVFCPLCNKCWPGWNINDYTTHHPNHAGDPFSIQGVFVLLDFISEEEEKSLVSQIDQLPWDISQSGRRKQNFGPKCNFKKKKVSVGGFKGFPKCTELIQHKFTEVPLLKNYITIEQCSLEYDPARGASIDPHIDDCWIWGERIVTVNFLADSVLTLVPYRGSKEKYNLHLAPEKNIENKSISDVLVRVPMPRRSLIILYGKARYSWEHFIYREDIISRRVCLAYREFSPEYLPGGRFEIQTKEILNKANTFCNMTIAGN